MGKLEILPWIFGINEPLIFGLPVVLNPIIAIPFISVPVLNTLISGLVMTCGWVPRPNGVLLPWTKPPIISGWLATGILIYYPFVKMLDKQYLGDEQAAAEAELTIDFDEVERVEVSAVRWEPGCFFIAWERHFV